MLGGSPGHLDLEIDVTKRLNVGGAEQSGMFGDMPRAATKGRCSLRMMVVVNRNKRPDRFSTDIAF